MITDKQIKANTPKRCLAVVTDRTFEAVSEAEIQLLLDMVF